MNTLQTTDYTNRCLFAADFSKNSPVSKEDGRFFVHFDSQRIEQLPAKDTQSLTGIKTVYCWCGRDVFFFESYQMSVSQYTILQITGVDGRMELILCNN